MYYKLLIKKNNFTHIGGDFDVDSKVPYIQKLWPPGICNHVKSQKEKDSVGSLYQKSR